jgi:hypothetical protein
VDNPVDNVQMQFFSSRARNGNYPNSISLSNKTTTYCVFLCKYMVLSKLAKMRWVQSALPLFFPNLEKKMGSFFQALEPGNAGLSTFFGFVSSRPILASEPTERRRAYTGG